MKAIIASPACPRINSVRVSTAIAEATVTNIMRQNNLRLSLVKSDFLIILFFNFIANSPYRFDVFRIVNGVIHLSAQMPDMYGDRVIAFAEIFVAPYLMKKIFRSDYIPFILTEYTQDRKFGGSKG